jgi:hypothetical protein
MTNDFNSCNDKNISRNYIIGHFCSESFFVYNDILVYRIQIEHYHNLVHNLLCSKMVLICLLKKKNWFFDFIKKYLEKLNHRSILGFLGHNLHDMNQIARDLGSLKVWLYMFINNKSRTILSVINYCWLHNLY